MQEDRLRPALTRAEDIGVREAAAAGEAGEDVGHVDVDGGEAGSVEGEGHFRVAVYALFSEDRDTWSGDEGLEGSG